MSEVIEVQHELDTCGLLCPEPLMMLHNKVREMADGELLKVVATDPSTQRDIPKFCLFLDHELLISEEENKQFVYVIRKASSREFLL